MDYKFLNDAIDIEHPILPDSDKINPCIKKNCESEIIKAIDFLSTRNNKILQVHGFVGTGKRQFINYLGEFIDKRVIKLEYYCKASTVCDDILISFLAEIEKYLQAKPTVLNPKITILSVKFQQHIIALRKPVLIILHTADDIEERNASLVNDWLQKLSENNNIKIVLSTRALLANIVNNLDDVQKIFLKAFPQEIFKEYMALCKFSCSDKQFEDFYSCTRGYYYYTALSLKIAQAMQLTIRDFLVKYKESGMKMEEFLCSMYLNLLPPAIRNFFWFLKTIRHGITLNALAILEIYDDFSIEFLKSNLMIFQDKETLFVQDLFYQMSDVSIPNKIQIRLHSYIIGIYEKQLKASLDKRFINISRQALRAEIEYHKACIDKLMHKDLIEEKEAIKEEPQISEAITKTEEKKEISVENLIKQVQQYKNDKNITKAIEVLKNYTNNEGLSTRTLVEMRIMLANLYKEISDYRMASYYYDLVETYYKQSNEQINLNYLYYELSHLYYKMYKKKHAIEMLEKVIYSAETSVSLFVDACIRLGNIYADENNSSEAIVYYQKALESINDNIETKSLCELYFKYALANDDEENIKIAFEYYNKCISVSGENVYKASAYSNLASCYYERENYSDALACFIEAYSIEKNNNNYEGIYYSASHIAEIYVKENSDEALKYLKEAKQSAEFLNEDFYVLKSTLALGDFYYNKPDKYKASLNEYFIAFTIANKLTEPCDITKIERRISDMKLRMSEQDFLEVENKYAK